jgi:class 3 adenylate cyclase/tetratricopeptide (TPR) repeat protein
MRFCGACGAPLPVADAPDVRKLVTLVFSDLKGSTQLGEGRDPEAIRGIMSRYFEGMREVIERHGGTVEKFVGDAVMAAFGIPRMREDDALRAVRAALEMRGEQARLNEEFERRFGARIEVRTGLNTGRVIAGDPSRGQSFATGDAVNVAARLEQAAAAGEILIGAETYDLVRDAVEVEPAEPLALKGKSEPLPAYRLLALRGVRPALATKIAAPLVGRDAELAQLVDAFERSEAEGALQVALVLGDAGVGKSRLAAELLGQIDARATVLTGRCLHYGEGITFWPIAEMVRTAAKLDDRDSPESALVKVGALLGEDEEAASLTEGVGAAIGLTDAELTIGEVFLGLRSLFEALAQRHGLVLVMDDLQWGETALFDFVEYLGRTSRGGPVLLVGLARVELLEQRPEWTRSFPCLRLAPLSSSESYRLASELLGAPVEHALLARLNEVAQGNPLFVEELLRMLVEGGELRRENGSWVAARELSEVTAPQTIEGLLSARLERLEPGERSVLEAASVIGQVFWPSAVDELVPAPEAVSPALADLVRAQLVVPDPGRFAGEDAYRFAHLLVRDAAYERLLKATRADYHAGFADWLEEKAGERLDEYEEIVGYHLERAHGYRAELGPEDVEGRALAERAAARLGAAGIRAYERDDCAAAIELLERAALLLPADDHRRRELMLQLGVALAEGGRLERAESMLAETAASAQAAGERPLELRALVECAMVRWTTDPEASASEAARLAPAAIEAFEELDDHLGLARALLLRGQLNLEALRVGEAEPDLMRALDHATAAGAERCQNEILLWIAGALWFGPVPAGEAIQRVDELARARWGAARRNAEVFAGIPLLHAMLGDFDAARELAARKLQLYQRLGFELGAVSTAGQQLGFVELLAGKPEVAEGELRQAYDALTAMGDRGYLVTVAHQLATALFEQGRLEEANRFAFEAEELCGPNDLEAQMHWRGIQARLRARTGDHEAAHRLASEAVELGRKTDCPSWRGDTLMVLAEVLRLAGDPEGASEALREAIDLYDAKENLVLAAAARGLLASIGAEGELSSEAGT